MSDFPPRLPPRAIFLFSKPPAAPFGLASAPSNRYHHNYHHELWQPAFMLGDKESGKISIMRYHRLGPAELFAEAERILESLPSPP